MQTGLTVAALIFATAATAVAQTPDAKKGAPAKPAQADVEQTLMQLERDTANAIIKRDAAAVARVFADDAVLTTPDGSMQTKTQFLADLKSGDLALQSSDIQDMKVRVFGDTAVVTYATTDKGKYKGQDIGGRYRWLDVFVRRAGSWQLVAGQGTPIAPPSKK